MALPTPPNNSNPIPNNPFYSPPINYVQGEYSPFILGSGLFLDYQTGILTASSGPTISSITAGAGIYVNNPTGFVTITNTGVLTLTAGPGISVTGTSGNLVITNTAPATAVTGTVFQVNTGTGLTGGPITTSGTISLANSGVGPGTYTNPTITVDATGRITFATNGSPFGMGLTATAPVQITTTFPQNISILPASTAVAGAVQLNNTVTSTSISQALTAAQGKVLQDQINNLLNTSNFSFAGTFDAATAQMVTVTGLGSTAGFLVGVDLPPPALTLVDYYVIVTTPGSYSPPGGGGPYAANAGDWLLCDGTTWQHLPIGVNLPPATTTDAGIVRLATVPETQTGTNATIAITPAGAAATYIPLACLTGKGALVAGSAAGVATALPVGADGLVLTANSACASGLEWLNPTSGTVTSVATGTGLTGGPIISTGTISLANTAVVPGAYTYASFTVDAQGRLTAASSGVAPNTTVTAPIVNTGTTVEPIIGVNTATTGQLGVVQVGTNIDVAAGVISVKDASTTQKGVVQLNDTVTSTSTTEALTAAQGKNLQDQINALLVSGNTILAGTFDAATSQVLTVTNDGTAAGFLVGSDLPAPAAGNTNYFVIVTVPGSYSPPGGGGPYTASQGDWFLSDGTVWQYLNVGADLPVATTGTAGVVQLATVGDTQAGTSTTLAVTPAGAAGTYIPLACLVGQGALVTATGAGVATALPLGTNGQVLSVNNALPEGLEWATYAGGTVTSVATGTGLTGGPVTTTGTIALADTAVVPGAYTNANITVDQQGRITAAASGSPGGVTAVTATSPILSTGGTTPDISLANTTVVPGAYTYGSFTVDAQGRLTAASSGANPVATVTGTSPITVDNTDPLNPIVGIGTATTAALGAVQLATDAEVQAGTDTTKAVTSAGIQSKLSDSVAITSSTTIASSTAVKTAYDLAAAAIPCSVLTAKGQIVVAAAASTPVALPVGVNGQVLVADSTSGTGLNWQTVGGTGTVTSITAGVGLNGGTITTSGTIDLADTAVVPGPYTYASFTVDQQGRLTAASSNTIPITCLDFDAKGDLLVGTASDAYTALPIGLEDKFLKVCAACTEGITWSDLTPATATIRGVMFGCTQDTVGSNTALGHCGLASLTTGTDNLALGNCALFSATSGSSNIALGPSALAGVVDGGANFAAGSFALSSLVDGAHNIGIGPSALRCTVSGVYNSAIGTGALNKTLGCFNTGMGHLSGLNLVTGDYNLFLGRRAGANLTSGNYNIAIGTNVDFPNPTGSCQLVIGKDSVVWLTGYPSGAIEPGFGVIDCTNSCGTCDQYLKSTGANAIVWANPNQPTALSNDPSNIVPTAGWTQNGASACDSYIGNPATGWRAQASSVNNNQYTNFGPHLALCFVQPAANTTGQMWVSWDVCNRMSPTSGNPPLFYQVLFPANYYVDYTMFNPRSATWGAIDTFTNGQFLNQNGVFCWYGTADRGATWCWLGSSINDQNSFQQWSNPYNRVPLNGLKFCVAGWFASGNAGFYAFRINGVPA